MAEPVLRNRTVPEAAAEMPLRPVVQEVPIRSTIAERARERTNAAQELLEGLRTRWEEMKERVEKQGEATAVSLRRELSQDADYVRIRARYYHEKRPLQTLGVVAAAAFVFGLTLGLWRR